MAGLSAAPPMAPQSRSHAVYCVHIEYRVPANAALRHVTPPPPCLLGGAPESSDVSVMPVGTFGESVCHCLYRRYIYIMMIKCQCFKLY